MRLYLEALETKTADDMTEPEFIRIDVTDMTEADKDSIKADITDIMSGMPYRLTLHRCGHEDKQPCEMVTL